MNGAPPYNVTQFPRRKLQPFDVFCPAAWQDIEPEPIQWIVKNCIPRGTVCLFSGDSGLGKSLLMQQLQTCTALGKPWLGNEVQRVRSFGFYCEDPKNILHWRQRDICRHLDAQEGELEDMAIAARVGMDNVLMDFNRRTDEGRATALYDQVRGYVREFGAELIILDTAAHTFNGNENVRAHVTAFVSALQEIANETNGAIVLCSHPSVSSMQSGTGYSGSTAWRATVRAHMYLKRPKGYDDESDDTDANVRVLKTMKANWGSGAGIIKLRWEGGVFQRVAPDRLPVAGFLDRIEIDGQLCHAIRYLIQKGERLAAESRANNNFLTAASRMPSLSKYQQQDLANSADRLFENEKLVRVALGTGARRRFFVRTHDTRYPDEGE